MEVLRRRPSPKATKPALLERALPPQVPDELSALEESMMLLGAYVQTTGRLRQSRLGRLQELLGALPRNLEDAKSWKSGLKELRSELAELEGREQHA